ncbi:MAG TPA: transglycosylase SLT domain-containing protein [Microthrixaceae bacterium]|nr:transglycosylase SLT domain-containing protein [Microthrixaceae bacterium]
MTVTSAPAFSAVARIATIRARINDLSAATSAPKPLATASPGATSPFDVAGIGAIGGADFSSILQAASAANGLGAAPANGAGTVDPQQVVEVASEYLGIPYVWGGTDPKTGLDCSGFLQHVFKRFGIDLPRVSRQQAMAGEAVPSIEQARPGDIVAFGQPVDHIGIYVGDNKIIHAPKTGDVVKISTIYRTPTAIRRLIPSGPVSGVAGLGGLGAAGGIPVAGGTDFPTGVARYSEIFEQAGTKWGISPKVLAAVAEAESGGNPRAVSPSGALGLMQFMPATARSFGIDPLDPKQAIDGAGRYLSEQFRAFGSMELALASYNAGPGAVRKYGGVPPFPETQAYVRKIMARIGDVS